MKEVIYDSDKKKAGEVELAEEIFSKPVNTALLYETVKMQLNSRRQGDAFCKNRALVSGTSAKVYRQKGTGRARHSDTKANIYVGGGKAFGPKPRDYSYAIPKKAKRNALKSALAAKYRDGNLLILKELSAAQKKTAPMVKKLKGLGVTSGLIVVDKTDDNLKRSLSNIAKVKLIKWNGLNAVDILNHEHLVITSDALNKVQEMLKS